MLFEFATAGRIIFGPGVVSQAGELIVEMGDRPFVVTGRHPDRASPLFESLNHANLTHDVFSIAGEPTVETIDLGVKHARKFQANVVVGFGGGSAIDAAKAIAALAANHGDTYDYLEVVGKGLPLEEEPLPCVALPTTAGTGAEVTRNAVLKSEERNVKVSLRSRLMLPAVALVDPVLTHSMPPAVTASTGLDALTQLVEAFVSRKATPLTDGLCEEGIARAVRSLGRAWRDGADTEAREEMALAGMLSGLALANAGLGAVHGFAGPLGGMFDAPHGGICAALLVPVMEANIGALREKAPQSRRLEKFRRLARILTGQPTARPEDAIERIRQIAQMLQVIPLQNYGLKKQHYDKVIEKARRASSMKGNPVELTHEALQAALHAATTGEEPTR